MADATLARRLANEPAAAAEAPDYALIELLFFAYRDFVGDPDRALARFGFGRAHHRVLHFVDRNPGLTIAELLDILRITKQSLNRVLKELIDQGQIEQRRGQSDRRQRRLFATAEGHALAVSLAAGQSRRIAGAQSSAGAPARRAVEGFLAGMVDEATRAAMARLAAARKAPPR